MVLLHFVTKGQIHIDDKKKADILNHQFSSVFSKPKGHIPPLIGQRSTTLPDITNNIAGVKKFLKDLNPKTHLVLIMFPRDS